MAGMGTMAQAITTPQWQLTQCGTALWQLMPATTAPPISTRHMAQLARTLTQQGAIITAIQLGSCMASVHIPASITFRLPGTPVPAQQLMAAINLAS